MPPTAVDRALARYVRDEVYPYSAFERDRLDAAGLGRGGVRGVADLARLPPVALTDIDDPAETVLRPDEGAIERFGSPGLVLRVAWSKARRRQLDMNREVFEPDYKPVHWHVDRGFPVGWTSTDLDGLADIGRRWLEHAGLGRYDVVAGMLPPGPNLAYWQLVLGCRAAGVAAMHLGPGASAAQLEVLSPSVLAGRAGDLARVLEELRDAGRGLAGLHTLLVGGELPGAPTRRRLQALCPGGTVAVVAAWAPPGVRGMWSECRAGALHLWPDRGVVEVIDPTTGEVVPSGRGELVWSPIGWHGTVVLRLRLGFVGELLDGTCACGRQNQRLRLVSQVEGSIASANVSAS